MTNRASLRAEQIGFTLIELMITIVISLLISGATYMVYVSSRHSFQFSEASARNQEAVRYSLDTMTYDLRHAGHVGCNAGTNPGGPLGASKLAILVNSADAWAKYSDAIRGYSASNLPAGVFTASEVAAGTDVLWVQYFSSKYWPLTNAGAPKSGTFQVVGNMTDFANTNIMAVTDCSGGDMFVATDVIAPASNNSAATIGHASGTYNTTGNLSRDYGKDAELLRFVTRIYFIGTSNGLPVLKRKNLTNMGLTDEEIADGISDMQIRYGIDKNADGYADQYLLANDIAATEWPLVVAAQICLQYVGTDDKLTEKSSAGKYQRYYNCAGNQIDATDRKFRQAANTASTFRNRVQ